MNGDYKIEKIEVGHFRGIPNILCLELNGTRDRWSDLIVFGENGHGKSSIVDAIEFVLRGTISRRNKAGHGVSHLNPMSYFSPQLPYAAIHFTSGEMIKRLTYLDRQQLNWQREAHQAYSFSPFIIRRADILSFIETPSLERLVNLMNYIRITDAEPLNGSENSDYACTKEDLIRLKRHRNSLMAELLKTYGIDMNPNIGFRELQAEINEAIHKGLNKDFRAKYRVTYPSSTVKRLKEINRLADEIKLVKSRLKLMKKPEANKLKFVGGVIMHLSEEITKALRMIQIGSVLYDFQFKIGSITESELDITLSTQDGKAFPMDALSEANCDALGLVILLEVVRYSFNLGQEKLLVLDDVLQSIDAPFRIKMIQYILKRFDDSQLIITTHDRLWKEQIVNMMNSIGRHHRVANIVNWDPNHGPIIEGQTDRDLQLKILLESSAMQEIASLAGVLLEEITNILSINLSCSISRKHGDRYTLGDLWPGVFKKLKKSRTLEYAESLNDFIIFRNLLGSHYNEYALSASVSEVKEFAMMVIRLYESVYCKKCSGYIKINSQVPSAYQCSCGEKALRACQ